MPFISVQYKIPSLQEREKRFFFDVMKFPPLPQEIPPLGKYIEFGFMSILIGTSYNVEKFLIPLNLYRSDSSESHGEIFIRVRGEKMFSLHDYEKWLSSPPLFSCEMDWKILFYKTFYLGYTYHFSYIESERERFMKFFPNDEGGFYFFPYILFNKRTWEEDFFNTSFTFSPELKKKENKWENNLWNIILR